MYDTEYAVGDFMDLAQLIGSRRSIKTVLSVLDDESLGRVVEALEDQYALANLACADVDTRRSGVLDE